MHSFFTLRRIFIFSLLTIAFFGCTRITSTDLGSGLIPAIDGVITKDTLLDVITDTFDDPDSTRIYKGDVHVVGNITNDPLFGKTKASIFFEVKPASYPFYISGVKDSIKVDSAVLILSYRGIFGDSTKPITLRVSEIDQSTPLDPYMSYPANYPSAVPITASTPLAPAKTFDIRRFSDSVNNRFENANNQIRIRLNDNVAKRFIKDYDSSNAYVSDSVFRTFFAGFALTADAGTNNALVKISLSDTNTKFALYYSTSSTGATQRDTSVTYFTFNTSTAGDANILTRDRTGSEISKHLTTTSKPDSLVYIQTSPGTYIRVKIPGLQGLSNRIIHRAELIAEQVPDDANLTTLETFLLPPRYLLLSKYDSGIISKRNIPNDYIISTSTGPNISTFGGFVTAKSILGYDKVYAYNFDLSRYVQGIVTRKDTSFTLIMSAPVNDSLRYTPPYPGNTIQSVYYVAPGNANEAGDGRVRLGGGTHSRFRMRLRIIYSRI